MRWLVTSWMVVMGGACAADTGGTSPASSSLSSSSSSSGGMRSSSRATPASSGSGASSAVTASGVVFTVGTAAYGETHADVPNGAAIDVVAGPQGGNHIWLSVGLPAQPAEQFQRVGFEVKDSTQVYAHGTTVMEPREVGAAWVDVGAIMYFDWGLDVTGWSAHPVDVTIRLLSQEDQELGRVQRTWNATCCTGGTGDADAGEVDGQGDGGVGNGGPSCDSFCTRVMDGCASTNAPRPFLSTEDCAGQCATWPYANFNTQHGGNTLVCRDWYAEQAESDVGACIRLTEAWSSFCIDP